MNRAVGTCSWLAEAQQVSWGYKRLASEDIKTQERHIKVVFCLVCFPIAFTARQAGGQAGRQTDRDKGVERLDSIKLAGCCGVMLRNIGRRFWSSNPWWDFSANS